MSLHWIVTGAASGIGQELAKALLARGDRVCACDVQETGLQALQAFASEASAHCLTYLSQSTSPALMRLVMTPERRTQAKANT